MMSRSYRHEENSIKFLCGLVEILPNLGVDPKMESLYLSRCYKLAENQSIDLPEVFKSRFRCTRCLSRHDNYKSNRIDKIKMDKFSKKLLKKTENGKNLTNYQQKYLKKVKNVNCGTNSNILVQTCIVCGYKQKVYLKKPAKFAKNTLQGIVGNETKIKKKRKKDRFAGLKKEVVLSLQTKNATKVLGAKKPTEVKSNNSLKRVVVQQKESFNAKKKKFLSLKSMLEESKQKKKAISPLQNFLKSI
ncbi:hypothetical protein FQA39_LY09654 [Lamprigera yunnana]|nr:hypothetical protein FQA39_LY09654 [Lamprigera yunnana]